jgi:hypothetical protein
MVSGGDGLAQPGIEEPHARVSRFFGVELTAKDVVLAHGGDEYLPTVLRDGVHPLGRIWLALRIVRGAIRVHKVIVECLVEAPIGVLLRIEEMHRIPAHVRNGLVPARKYVDLARNKAQTRDGGALGRGLEKDLHADAYPKIRSTRGDVLSERLKKPARGQAIDSSLESSHAREDDTLNKSGLNMG